MAMAATVLSVRTLPPTGGLSILLGLDPARVHGGWQAATRPVAALGGLTGPQTLLALTAMAMVIGVLWIVMAWLATSLAAADEPYRATLAKTIRLVALLPASLVLPWVAGAVVVWVVGLWPLSPAGQRTTWTLFWLLYWRHVALAAGMWASIWVLVVWLRVLRACAEPGRPQERLARCDACGYDLRGIDLTGRCPECGLPIEESLGPGRRRPTQWEAAAHAAPIRSYVQTVRDVILRPRVFFRSMRAWAPLDTALRFAIVTFTILALVTAIALVRLLPAPYGTADPAFHVLLGMSVFLAGLAAVVLPPAVVALIGAVRGDMNRQLPAARAACYLAAWLIPAVLVNFPASILLIRGEPELRRLVTMLQLPVTGYDVRDFFLLLLNFGIAGWWLRQFTLACGAIRYANR